ncbi:GNAT family N-acetyltransferase [Natrialbaceae archaeon A-CW3]
MNHLKQRKREKRHQAFIDGAIEWVENKFNPQYLFVQTDWHYDDIRPFTWNDFDILPQYTYVIELEPGEADVMGQFSQNPRRNIRNHDETEYSVEEGGKEAVEWTIHRVNERYAEQGLTPRFDPGFVVELYDRLDEGMVRPYTLSVDGEVVAGSILLEDEERAYSWQGSARPEIDIPANDLLEWQTMKAAMHRDVELYEILGANTPRLNEWKTKFNPDTRTYYTAKRSTRSMNLVEELYVGLRDRSRLVKELSPGQ